MNKLLIFLLWHLFIHSYVRGQGIDLLANLQIEIDSADQELILSNLEGLLWQIAADSIDEKYIEHHGFELSKAVFSTLYQRSDEGVVNERRTLVNFYPLGKERFSLTIAVQEHVSQASSALPRLLLQIHAVKRGNQVTFTLPLWWKTRNWLAEQVGAVKYISREKIDRRRAHLFDQKNAQIAMKFQVEPDPLTFYICENYQEILELLGVLHDREEAGVIEDGWGVVGRTIFAIRGNEDFSHDIFHYYSEKVHDNADRNWIAEEGMAYLWGNAYYVDQEGEMVEQDRLLSVLARNLQKENKQSLLNLFETNPTFYPEINRRISVRSVIAGLLCREIERKWGMEGVKQIINCGRTPDSKSNFLKVVDALLSINRENFETEVHQLLMDYH